MPQTAAELNKLKVAELKERLKQRDLPTTGNKADLVARLVEADSAVQEAVEPEPEPCSIPPTAEPPAAAAAATEGDEWVVVAPATDTAADPKAQAPAQAQAADDGTGVVTTMAETEEERRIRRAARFGVPIVQPAPAAATITDDKIRMRRERFGVVQHADQGGRGGRGGKAVHKESGRGRGHGTGAPPAELSAADAERLEKRRERFGLMQSEEGPKRQKDSKGTAIEPRATPKSAEGEQMSEETRKKLEARTKRFATAPKV